MTARNWMKSVEGKKIDFDGVYRAQCVDIIKKYFVDVIGIPAIKNDAIGYWTNYPTAHFTRIQNTPSFVPKSGDIIIWGKGVGTYGHIAIVWTATVNWFDSLDQNWPYSDGTTPAKFIHHNYNSVLGVLRPKKDVNFDQEAWDAAVAAQKVKEEEARLAREEADRVAREEAARVKAEQEKLAKEQAKLEAELKAKQEAEAKAEADKIEKEKKEKEMSQKFTLNKQDLLKVGKGALIALAGALGAYLLTLVGAVDAGVYTPFVAGAISVIANLLIKFASGK